MRSIMRCMCILAFGFNGVTIAQPADRVESKTITMIIGFPPGGGTDISGRLIANFLGKYFREKRSIIVHNVPGADGMLAMNFMAQQAKRDGSYITMAASTVADPINYRKRQSSYDPTQFQVIGGIGRGGSTLVIRTEAESRLYDRSLAPVMIGSVGGMPRSGSVTAAWGIEFLQWNGRWVIGYRGTNDLFLALERGEIEIAATSSRQQVENILAKGNFKQLMQTGIYEGGHVVARSEALDVPVFPSIIEGKIHDDVQKRAFAYWYGLVAMDKWLALPPGVAPDTLRLFRAAFDSMVRDPEFLNAGRMLSEDFEPQAGEDVTRLIDSLAKTPPEALEFITGMIRKQGVSSQ